MTLSSATLASWTACVLLPFAHRAPAPAEGSLLAAVPQDAYVLMHCRDVAGLRDRAELNDWYRLLGSSQGEPLLSELANEFRSGTHSDLDQLLAMAGALEGEIVFFDTQTVAGFVAEPPARRAELTDLMRNWMPKSDTAARTIQLEGGTVELVAWPDELDGWSGRAGHFAAFVDHPQALAIYSGDDSEAVMAALTEGITGLVNGGVAERRAPLVSSYLAAGGGKAGGVELFVDFTPLVDQAETALKEAVDGVLPDPSRLLGLEGETWMHVTADVFQGTRIECNARLRLPPDTLAARLADTFKPLPHTLPADLPKSVWGLWALNWDVKVFYQIVREAYEEAGLAEGLEMVDGAIVAAQGLANVDPVADVLNQFAGDFALYLVDPPSEEQGGAPGETSQVSEMDVLAMLGFYAGLIDGDAFMGAFERLIDAGGLESEFDTEELAGVEAYVFNDDDGLDGGIAFLPRAFTIAISRHVLERNLQALTRAAGASLLDGSRMQAAIVENMDACFLMCVEMTPMRVFLLPEMQGDLSLPPLEEGQSARNPFDAQLIIAVRRTADGFDFRLHTR